MTTFAYRPGRLEAAVTAALEVHRKIHDPSPAHTEMWLAEFVRKLQRARADEYRSLAEALRMSQLRVLARYLPRLRESDLFGKAISVLLWRPNADVAREFWGLLGRYVEDGRVIELLDSLPQHEGWRLLEPVDLPIRQRPLHDAASVAAQLAHLYVARREPWKACAARWTLLAPGTAPAEWELLALGQMVLRDLLCRSELLVRGESAADLHRWSKAVLRVDSDFDQFALNYLVSLAATQWDDDVLASVVGRMGDPRTKPLRWQAFPEHVRREVVRRINTRKLAEFFLRGAGDRERFEFWQRFVDFMGPNSEGRLDEGQGFFEFPGFGVVEFMEVGNAAYLYPLPVYERMRGRRRVPNYMLKDQAACFDRILHVRGWTLTWIPLIERMIGRAGRD